MSDQDQKYLLKPRDIIRIPVEFVWEIEPSGSISWHSQHYPYSFHVTPFWEGQDGIDIEVNDHLGMPKYQWLEKDVQGLSKNWWTSYPINENHSQFNKYLDIMKKFLPELLKKMNEAEF